MANHRTPPHRLTVPRLTGDGSTTTEPARENLRRWVGSDSPEVSQATLTMFTIGTTDRRHREERRDAFPFGETSTVKRLRQSLPGPIRRMLSEREAAAYCGAPSLPRWRAECGVRPRSGSIQVATEFALTSLISTIG